MTDGSLGLPTLPRDSAGQPASDREDRAYVEFTLPPELLGPSWPGDFDDRDRVFRICELTPVAQQRAIKLGGQDQAKAAYELCLASLWQVGDWRCQRDRRRLEQWYTTIGAKARRLVDAAFMSLNSVSEDDTERFLASGRPSSQG